LQIEFVHVAITHYQVGNCCPAPFVFLRAILAKLTFEIITARLSAGEFEFTGSRNAGPEWKRSGAAFAQ
jgi:hypothetical protein